ncbi:hypothetical protein [Arthrobacter monumenti]
MSNDWTILSRLEPTHEVLIAALLEVMPHAGLRDTGEESVLEITDAPDPDSPALLAIELPRLIQIPAEPQRLLAGTKVSAIEGVPTPLVSAAGGAGLPAGQPLWWQDLHSLGDPEQSDPSAGRLAHAIAARVEGAVMIPSLAER